MLSTTTAEAATTPRSSQDSGADTGGPDAGSVLTGTAVVANHAVAIPHTIPRTVPTARRTPVSIVAANRRLGIATPTVRNPATSMSTMAPYRPSTGKTTVRPTSASSTRSPLGPAANNAREARN